MNQVDFRTFLTILAFCAAGYLLLAAALQLLETTRRVEITVSRADLAAYQIAQVLQEARDITAQAALEVGELP